MEVITEANSEAAERPVTDSAKEAAAGTGAELAAAAELKEEVAVEAAAAEAVVEADAGTEVKSETRTEPEPVSEGQAAAAARSEVNDETDGGRDAAGHDAERAEEGAGDATEDVAARAEDPARPEEVAAAAPAEQGGSEGDLPDGARLTRPRRADVPADGTAAEVNGTPGAASSPQLALADIEDEEVLDKMLSEERDHDARDRIRAARRDLRKKKRGRSVCDSGEEDESEEQIQKGAGGHGAARAPAATSGRSSTSATSATDKAKSSLNGAVSAQTARTPPTAQTARSHPTPPRSGPRVGSIFDREDASPVAHAGVRSREAAPRGPRGLGGSGPASRRAIVERLERQSGGQQKTASPVKLQRAGSFGATTIKQMLLEWCRAKTRGYEHVDIQNFSTSWSDGLAFCALVHHFFPEAFDFSELEARNRRHNFDLAFTTAEKLASCDPLLEVDDMLSMGPRPDPKCVFTYVQWLCQHLKKVQVARGGGGAGGAAPASPTEPPHPPLAPRHSKPDKPKH